MRFRFLAVALTVAGFGALVGCANDGGLLTTSSVSPGSSTALAPRVDPACVSLSEQIETLQQEGVAQKVEKAAARKYKLKSADLAKADQLNKINAEFHTRCSSLPAKQTAQGPAAPGAQVAAKGPGGAAATIPQPTVPPPAASQ